MKIKIPLKSILLYYTSASMIHRARSMKLVLIYNLAHSRIIRGKGRETMYKESER